VAPVILVIVTYRPDEVLDEAVPGVLLQVGGQLCFCRHWRSPTRQGATHKLSSPNSSASGDPRLPDYREDVA
jgi:hypothetical protein